MKCKVKIKGVNTIDEIPGYWTNEDLIHLLEECEFPDAKAVKPEELSDLLGMALSDLDPDESARIVLKYKLGDVLSEGQIQNISHEMEEDKISEEYPDISLHYSLFNINQILYKSYNGKFPHIKATVISLEVTSDDSDFEVNKTNVLKVLSEGLSDNSPIKRLYIEELEGKKAFSEADSILWTMTEGSGSDLEIVTSDYWISKSDVVGEEYDCSIKVFGE